MNPTRLVRFFTVNRPSGPEEIRIKGSRFISFLYPVSREADVTGILSGLKKTFHDAAHICFAFRLEKEGIELVRYHDDGEPPGTAGLPIYNQIKGKELFNVFLAVVRYFGGIKLGTGGLSRAYGLSAKGVLERAEKISRQVMKRASIIFDYGQTGEIRNLLQRFSVEIIGQQYSERGVKMELLIPEVFLNDLAAGLQETSRGEIGLALDSG